MTQPPQTPPLPAPGDPIGKYRIDRVLGQGGMGIVFQATHVKLGQSVAIKLLMPELAGVPELVARFEREARAAARLRHRNAARVVDVDQTDAGVPYFVMELLHGHDLEAELEARGPLPIGEAVHFVLQAAAAMSEAHEAGTVHRDLKPSNLFLNQESDGSTCVKVLDFGISKVSADDVHVTSTQTQMGTPLYMSPEQVRSAKNVDHRTDVWSLGVILYELLAGQPPFHGSAAGIGAAIVSDPPPPLREARPDVPEELAAVVARAMEKDPARRYASMRELARALSKFSGAQVALPTSDPQLRISKSEIEVAPTLAATPLVESRTAGSWTASGTATPRRFPVWAIALAVVVPLAGIGAWLGLRGGTTAAGSAIPLAVDPPPSTAASVANAPSTAAPSTAPALSTAPPASSSATTTATARPSARPSAARSATTGAPTVKPSNPDRL